jgi:hypothetical protein
MVTCPSPARTTLPLRRTHKIVVERILFFIYAEYLIVLEGRSRMTLVNRG